MLWACLHFSELPLHAVFDAHELAAPCAILSGPHQRQHISHVNNSAQHADVRLEQPLAAARALCPRLQAKPRDATSENRLLHSLAAWAYQFSSHVSLGHANAESQTNVLLIEVGSSLRLFGGWPRLERCLRQGLADLGYEPTIAAAPFPAAARVLAARHDGFFTSHQESMLTALAHLPIAQSGLPASAISLLYNVGTRTLKDVFAMPRPELARRVGPAVMALLDRMRGMLNEVLTTYQPPDRFEHRIDLDDRVEAWPPLLFPLKRLCNELSMFLGARDGGVQRCELVLDHESRAATRLPIELLTPQRESKLLYELIRGRLERASLAAAVSGIALVATDLPTLRPRHHDLFEPAREQGLQWPELTERLRAHLGDGAVKKPVGVADHRPERAWQFDLPAKAITELRPRPLWLLSRALPLRNTPLRILAGPERIESGWWDGADARRDYYIVQTREGQRAWAFLAAGASDGWMLHGWFA